MRRLVVLLVVLCGCGGPRVIQPEGDPILMAAIPLTKLSNAYNENELAADQEYKGKRLKMTGAVREVSKDLFGSPYLILTEAGASIDAQCSFGKDQEARLAALRKGDKVEVACEVRGKLVYIQAKDCRLQ